MKTKLLPDFVFICHGRSPSQLVYNTVECYETTSLSQTTKREGVTTVASHNAALSPSLVSSNEDPLFG